MKRKEDSDTFSVSEAEQIHTFIKENGQWLIHLPEYLAQGWSKKDLTMKEGTSKLLNILAQGKASVSLRMSTDPFAGADRLELIEHCDAPGGGAVYLLESCHERNSSTMIWICDIALFVFGDMPEEFYVQQVPGKAKAVNR
jgi:hypothetical protein